MVLFEIGSKFGGWVRGNYLRCGFFCYPRAGVKGGAAMRSTIFNTMSFKLTLAFRGSKAASLQDERIGDSPIC